MSSSSNLLSKDKSFPEPTVEILKDIVVDQIAAGEVVERPASVVKELIENSIDAGSSQIVISVFSGGRSKISVTDNGCGMSKSNARLAMQRFGTSKIREASDLSSISSLGFRGEALPSIAAVSKFKLQTRARNSDQGVALSIEGGVLRNEHEASFKEGCKITVEDIFFNIPARKKFLRTERTELAYIKAVILDIACAYPEIRFELSADGKAVVLLPTAADFSQRASQILGKDVELIKVRGALEVNPTSAVVLASELKGDCSYLLEGFISKPLQAVSSAKKLRVIVNGRAVKDKLILRAIKEGYGNFLKPGKYPQGVIKLDLPPGEVDINVHPQKSEVRFRAPDQVFRLLAGSVKRALSDEETGFFPVEDSEVRELKFSSANPTFSERRDEVAPRFFSKSYRNLPESSFSPEFSDSGWVNTSEVEDSFSSGRPSVAVKLSEMRYVGQIFKCYLLFEADQTFGIVDMHAAHEIVTFVKMKERLLSGDIPIQGLISPEVVEISEDLFESFSQLAAPLKRLGLDVELFGENSLVVRGTPAPLGQINTANLLEEILALSAELINVDSVCGAVEDVWDKVLASMACHGSIRSGRSLRAEEALALVESLESTAGSAFCPHGRPVVQYFTKEELELRFGRIQ